MTLKQHHFQTPERPKEEEYMFGVGDKPRKLIIDPQFEKDTAEWESLYGEPITEWFGFNEKELTDKFYCLHINDLKEMKQPYYCFSSKDIFESFLKASGEETINLSDWKWTDKATYDAIHQRLKDHQVKFPGFKKHIYKSTITEFSREVEDKTIAVCFWADTGETVVSIINDQNEIIFEMSGTEIHVEEFERVLKNRNIKL